MTAVFLLACQYTCYDQRGKSLYSEPVTEEFSIGIMRQIYLKSSNANETIESRKLLSKYKKAL